VHPDLKQNYKQTPRKGMSKEVPSAWRHRENNWTEGNLALRANNVVDRITSKGTSLFLQNTKCEANSVIPTSDICIKTNERSSKTFHVL